MQEDPQSVESKIAHLLRTGIADSYVRNRISNSFAEVDAYLQLAGTCRKDAAVDIGCGAGHLTFGLSNRFDRTLGVDTNRKAIRTAQEIARRADIECIAFEHASVDDWEPAAHYDFALCNLMSHNAASRMHLIETIAHLLKPDGVVVYTDICEGYAPLEIHRAILKKDIRALVARLQQMLSGFGVGGGFKFFAIGSARPIFESLGCEVSYEKRSTWNGVAMIDLLIARRSKDKARSKQRPVSGHRDYLRMPADFAAIRALFAETVAAREPEGLAPDARVALKKAARDNPNPYAPFLLHLVIADLVMPSMAPVPHAGDLLARLRSRLESATERLPKPLGKAGLGLLSATGLGAPKRSFSWEDVAELDRDFISIVRKRAGLGDGIDD